MTFKAKMKDVYDKTLSANKAKPKAGVLPKTAQREAKVWCIVGPRGTGKTTRVLEYAKKIKRRLLVVTATDDYQSYETFTRVTLDEIKELPTGRNERFLLDLNTLEVKNGYGKQFEEIIHVINPDWQNGSLFFDDASAIVPRQSTYALNRLLVQTRHKSRDTFLTYHTFKDVPGELTGKIDFLMFFRQSNGPGKNWHDYADYKKLVVAYNKLMSSNMGQYETLNFKIN